MIKVDMLPTSKLAHDMTWPGFFLSLAYGIQAVLWAILSGSPLWTGRALMVGLAMAMGAVAVTGVVACTRGSLRPLRAVVKGLATSLVLIGLSGLGLAWLLERTDEVRMVVLVMEAATLLVALAVSQHVSRS